MRLHLVSDLHLDHDRAADEAFLQGLKAQPDVDLLVVAGDWYSISRPLSTASLVQRFLELYQRVLLVPGNHDVWLGTPGEAAKAMEDAAGSDAETRVFFCPEPRKLEIAGQKFIAGTMWFRKPSLRQEQNFIDFRKTQAPRDWFFEQQRKFQDLLYDGWDNGNGPDLQDTVVVTHHLPHPASTPKQFVGSPTDHFFMCNMTGAIMERRPKLWLHGHTHDPSDYVVYKTRVVCHPRGYPFEYRHRPPYEPKLIEVGVASLAEDEEE